MWYRRLSKPSSYCTTPRAASIDLANIHRMPTPEGYCILVFEELIEQEEENAPEIPGGLLIFNPHDVENRTNIGELEPGELFFWPTVSLTCGELELYSPGQSPLPGDGTLADGGEEIRRPETPKSGSRTPSPPFLTPSPLPASCTAIAETSPANGLEALRYHDNPAPHFDMSIPPCGSWESKDALLAAAQAHAAKSGYAIAVGSNSGIKKKTGRFEGFLVCTAGGKKREKSTLTNEDDRQRKGRSYKCECPMSMNIRMRADGRWYLTERVLHPEMSTHNHLAVDDATTLYQHRVLSKEDRELVINNVIMGVPTSRTTALLNRPGGALKVKHRDVYNLTAASRREARRGMPAPEAFLKQLEEETNKGQIYFDKTLDDKGHISRLVIADRRSIRYLNINPDVLMLDCTYKTNKFGMPLLDIVGVDGMNKTFTIGLCFLDQETEEDYDWALERLKGLYKKNIFPSVVATDCDEALLKAVAKTFPGTKTVLCFWHIAKNVLANNKDKFETAERWEEFLKDFKIVVYSKTEEEFRVNLADFKEEYHWNNGEPHRSPADGTEDEADEKNLEGRAVTYCLGWWLGPYKKQVVHAWVDRHFNCGMTTTSR